MRKYILLLPLLLLVACGENNSTKYCADGSLAPCNDGSPTSAQTSAPVNNQPTPNSTVVQPGVGQQPPIVYQQQAPAQQSNGFSWGDAAMGYVIGNMLFGGNNRTETVRERVIERPAPVETRPTPAAPIAPSKQFNGQESRSSTTKALPPPAAKPSAPSKPSVTSSPSRSSSSSSRSSSRK